MVDLFKLPLLELTFCDAYYWPLETLHAKMTPLPSSNICILCCTVSAERCDPPAEILAGNISFTNGDPANILVGDVISYACDTGTELHGPMQRYCLRNGNWSGSEPKCIGKQIM